MSACAQAQPGTAVPVIRFDSTVYQFEPVIAGEVVRHDFAITNLGERTLEISGVFPGCGCITAGDFSRSIPPGKTGAIHVDLSTGQLDGQISRSVTVAANDSTQPRTTLEFRGLVQKPIELKPPRLVLRPAPGANSETNRVRIINHLKPALQPTGLACDSPLFKVALVTIRAGREYEIIVRTQPFADRAPVQATVSLNSGVPDFPLISFPVLATPAVKPPPAQSP